MKHLWQVSGPACLESCGLACDATCNSGTPAAALGGREYTIGTFALFQKKMSEKAVQLNTLAAEAQKRGSSEPGDSAPTTPSSLKKRRIGAAGGSGAAVDSDADDAVDAGAAVGRDAAATLPDVLDPASTWTPQKVQFALWSHDAASMKPRKPAASAKK